MKRIRTILSVALAAGMVALAGCAKEQAAPGGEAAPGSKVNISFMPASMSRMAIDNSGATSWPMSWQEGDTISLFAMQHDGSGSSLDQAGLIDPDEVYVRNMKFTYTAGEWTSEEDIYYPDNGDALDFAAVFPYSAAYDDGLTIKIDARTDDFPVLVAIEKYSARVSDVELYFFNPFSAMIEVRQDPAFTGTVTLNGIQTVAMELDMEAGSVDLTEAGPYAVEMFAVDGQPGVYRLFLPAGPLVSTYNSFPAGSQLVTFEATGGATSHFVNTGDIDLEYSGDAYVIDVN